MSRELLPCWRCDECGHTWIIQEAWRDTTPLPERCASSKCRKRSWNKDTGEPKAQTSSRGEESERLMMGANPSPSSKPDMAVLRAICSGDVVPVGGINADEKSAPLCPHKEWSEDGEQYRCRLQAGHKGKCMPGERVS